MFKQLIKKFAGPTYLQGSASAGVNLTGTTAKLSSALDLKTLKADGGCMEVAVTIVTTPTDDVTLGLVYSADGTNFEAAPRTTYTIDVSVVGAGTKLYVLPIDTNMAAVKVYAVQAGATDTHTIKSRYVTTFISKQ